MQPALLFCVCLPQVRSALGTYSPLVAVGTGGDEASSVAAPGWHTFWTLPDPEAPPQAFTMCAFADAGTGTCVCTL